MPLPARWALLILLSALSAVLLTLARLPAGWLLGPMVAGIVFAVAGVRLRVPPLATGFSQALMGCLIAQTITAGILKELLGQWPLFLGVLVAVMLLSWGLGWLLSLLKVIPPREALWGSSPGAAAAMVIMAQVHQADARLVALMQYARVLLVVMAASVVTTAWLGGADAGDSGLWSTVFAGWGDVPALSSLAATLAVSAIGVIADRLGFSSAGMLLPLFLGVVLNVTGFVTPVVPESLAVFSYLVIGWGVGLSFDREALTSSIKVLPWIVLSNLVLIALCGALGWAITRLYGVDPLSAYLATSPGGANTVAAIAMTSPVDTPFIMAMQVCRMGSLVVFGPIIARALARRSGR